MKNFSLKSILLIMMLFCGANAYSQQYLYIKKKGEMPKERIAINQRITFKIRGEKEWISGFMKELNGNSIRVNDRLFYFSNIEGIRTYNSLLKTFGSAFWVGGAFFTSIAAVNSIINDERPILSNRQIGLGAGLGLLGIVVTRISRKTFLKEEGYSFEVIDLNN